jgi:hypothetical protein
MELKFVTVMFLYSNSLRASALSAAPIYRVLVRDRRLDPFALQYSNQICQNLFRERERFWRNNIEYCITQSINELII